LLRVHQFATQQVGKGSNRRNEFHSSCKLEYVHSKATYPLRVHQLLTKQVGKEGNRRNEFVVITQNLTLKINIHKMFIQRHATYPLTVYKFTTQQVGKRRQKERISLNTKANLEYVQILKY